MRNFNDSLRKLNEYFGADKLLYDITTSDADVWRQWLVNQKYIEVTISKVVKHAKHFLLMANRKGLVRENPFQHLKAGGEENESRKRFIEQQTIDRAIEVAPDTQWKLIIALARYGGLRCPSEVLALTWDDADWEAGKITVMSPKTKRQGKPYRVMPLFPELIPLLERAFEDAEEGTLYVIEKYRNGMQTWVPNLNAFSNEPGLSPGSGCSRACGLLAKQSLPTSTRCMSLRLGSATRRESPANTTYR